MKKTWTDQELFDHVVGHLLEQRRPSVSYDLKSLSYTCRYRGNDGGKCAVGWVIPDELYCDEIEGWITPHPDILYRASERGMVSDDDLLLAQILFESGVDDHQLELLGELQAIHDRRQYWWDGFHDLAMRAGLVWKFGDTPTDEQRRLPLRDQEAW